jgi:hypothetical protein
MKKLRSALFSLLLIASAHAAETPASTPLQRALAERAQAQQAFDNAKNPETWKKSKKALEDANAKVDALKKTEAPTSPTQAKPKK